jgi:hypothetical protein
MALNNVDEYVQVAFTNLVQPNKRLKLTSTMANKKHDKHDKYDKYDKFEMLGVIIYGRLYRFSAICLYKLEPNNTLMNPHSIEFKKRINPSNHTLEYMEPMQDFELIIDYINGYNIDCFEKIFKNNYSRIDNFKIMVSELSMINLLSKMDYYYPILNINGMLVNISRKYIMNLEPHNKLLNISHQSENNVFTYFRDYNIFQDYFLEYIQGKKTKTETITKIENLKNYENYKNNEYIISKINNDIAYYGFDNLLN